ncbi:MAG TPA: DUF3820 family protein [Kiritimatiellia bacterium]|nr:DUF3820 family protein [Kiritimatiellia bacterium]
MDDLNLSIDQAYLVTLSKMRMPFGKYRGWRLVDLPEPYVVWFSRKGFPEGELGEMLRIVFEIKANGLEYLFDGRTPGNPLGGNREEGGLPRGRQSV